MNKRQITITIALAVILLAYITSIVIIDPYNYFNTRIVDQDTKDRICFPLNERLSRIIEYNQNLSPNILIGDSRIQNLDIDEIKDASGDDYFNFGYGGCNLPELIQTFWFAAEKQDLKNVVIGISFGMYNKYNNTNLFINAHKSSNLFNYIFNGTNFQVIYYLIKDKFSKEEIILGVPEGMNKEDFWIKLINEQTQKFYNGYKYPDDFNQELIEIKSFCDAHNINLIFFIPPEHIEVQEKIELLSLTEEHQKFIDDVVSLGTLYDFNINNKFTRDKENFFDPFHFRRDIDTLLIHAMFSNTELAIADSLLRIVP